MPTGLLGTYFPGEDPMAPVDLMPRGLLGPSVLGRMQAHGDAQRQRMAAGDYSPTPMNEESMWLADDLAGGLLGSLPGGVMGAIKAYHGSPHRFDRFDMSKIGTGEGAQAYGHGLYFSEAPGVADSYRAELRTPARVRAGTLDPGSFSDALAMRLAKNGMAPQEAERAAASVTGEWFAQASGGRRTAEQIERYARDRAATSPAWQAALDLPRPQWMDDPGALYTTRLDVEPEDLLDWDAPLSQQSEKVRAALEPLLRPSKATTQVDDDLLAALMDGPGADELRAAADAMPDWDPTGAEVYRALFGGKTESVFGNSANARQVSQALREAGIPGIRYLDQGSRASGEGTRNFVIFDDKLIDIEGVE